MRDLAADPQLREAIAIASPSLDANLDSICAGDRAPDRAKVRRVLLATVRYALRLHLRPTPFGTFAGVSTARLGSAATARVGPEHRRDVRLDCAFAHHLRDQVPSKTLVTQPLLTRRGERLVNLAHSDQAKSVAVSELLTQVLDRATGPTAVDELAALICSLAPEVADPDARAYLRTLQTEGFLLNGDRPTTSCADVPGLDSAVQDYLDASPDDRHERWTAATRRAGDPEGAPLLVNLVLDAGLTLPPSIHRQVAVAAEALCRLAPDYPASDVLDSYHQRFLHRYGTAELVPVLDLLDSHRGLGAPDGYQHPRAARTAPAPAPWAHPLERDQALADLVAGGGPEVVLDPALVTVLATETDRPPPRTFDLGFSLHAADLGALARGDYLLACASGSVSGGATVGRFADLLGVRDELRSLVDRGQADVVAELRALPPQPRQGNVLPWASTLETVIEVGPTSSDVPADRIDVRDIAIGSDGHALYAVDVRHRRVIDPVRLNMLNPVTALPKFARFLSALPLGGRRMWSPWDWGRLAALPRRPRVRMGRVILVGRQWRPPASVMEAASDSTFDVAIERWRQQSDVPSRVRVATGDQRLDLDLDHPLHRALLREHLRRHGATTVEEGPDGWCAAHGIDEPYGLMDGHASEVIFPILTPGHDQRVGPAVVPWTSVSTPPVRHLPGGDWLSAKIYADADFHDRLLTTGLGGLLDRLPPSAYLLRYADPDPHLRVRVPTPAGGHPHTLEILNAWTQEATSSHLIRTVSLDEYAPEIDRYGGVQAMAAAEMVFAADTALVRHLLATAPEAGLPGGRPTVAAASCLDLLEAFVGVASDADEWVQVVLPPALAHGVPTTTRRGAHQYVLQDFADLLTSTGADLVRARRAAAAEHGRRAGPVPGDGHSAALSLLHLHCNRYLGLSQAQEHTAYGILRSAVAARTGRRKASS